MIYTMILILPMMGQKRPGAKHGPRTAHGLTRSNQE